MILVEFLQILGFLGSYIDLHFPIIVYCTGYIVIRQSFPVDSGTWVLLFWSTD